MLLNKEQVLQFLPHRDPFLFIDSVESVDLSGCETQEPKEPKDLVGAVVTAHYSISKDMTILEGHFPGNPILPGVVQVEMMAQASAFLSIPLVGTDVSNINVETLLLAVDKSKFRKPIVPGMDLVIKASLAKVRGMIANYEGEILCDGAKVAEATIMAKIGISKK